MNGKVTARLDQAAFDQFVDRLGNHKAAIASVRALNRSIVSARLPVIKKVAADMGIRQKTVRDAITIEDATRTKLVARMTARGARLPLIDFAAKGPMPSRGRGRGVTAKVGGKRTRYKNAFLATTRSGHTGVFKRDESRPMSGKSRGAWSKNLPIVQLHGPSIVHVFEKYRDVGVEAGREALMKNLSHEMQWAIDSASVS